MPTEFRLQCRRGKNDAAHSGPNLNRKLLSAKIIAGVAADRADFARVDWIEQVPPQDFPFIIF